MVSAKARRPWRFELDNFEFRNVWWLLLLIPTVPITLYLTRRPTATIKYSSLALIEPITSSWRIKLSWLPSWLYTIGCVLGIIALAGPRTSDQQVRIDRDGIAIVMVIDLSSSMNARDLVADDRSVDRLQVVKKVFRNFVLGEQDLPGRPNDMIGIVAFAGHADSICPLTFDHQNLALMVEQLEIVTAQAEDGTAIGDGLALAVERLRESKAKSRIAILLTDGEHNAGVIQPQKAAELAADQGVKVYTIGAGTEGVAPVPVRDPFTGETVLRAAEVRIDEKTLKSIADATDGHYYRATDVDSLSEIYSQIDKLERTEISEELFVRYTEKYTVILLLAGLFLTISTLLRSTILRQIP